jgi:AAA15 family ATPase/GTPase
MEACYLSQSTSVSKLFEILLEIKTHRNIINNLLSNKTREEDIRALIKDNIGIELFIQGNGGEILNKEIVEYEAWDDGLVKLSMEDGNVYIYTKYTRINAIPGHYDEDTGKEILHEYPNIYNFSDLVTKLDAYFNNTRYKFNLNFVSPFSNSNTELENMIGESKLLDDKYENLNQYLLEVFNVSSIDIIKNKPMLKLNGRYRELSDFGQGIKSFINIISSILLLKDDIVFIDEIENGIHYTNYDKLWELILKVSKEQNVQVFATTHSKEMIKSYARVAKKLEDDDIRFIEIGKNKQNNIRAIVMDNNRFFRELEAQNEVRGW